MPKVKKEPKPSKYVTPEAKATYKKRNKEKYPALNFKRQVANRKEYLDQDYIDKLSPKEKEWLNSYIEETVIANFNHKGKKLYKTKKKKREMYGDNNARNRCTFSKALATYSLLYLNNESMLEVLDDKSILHPSDIEDALIDYIDSKNEEQDLD